MNRGVRRAIFLFQSELCVCENILIYALGTFQVSAVTNQDWKSLYPPLNQSKMPFVSLREKTETGLDQLLQLKYCNWKKSCFYTFITFISHCILTLPFYIIMSRQAVGGGLISPAVTTMVSASSAVANQPSFSGPKNKKNMYAACWRLYYGSKMVLLRMKHRLVKFWWGCLFLRSCSKAARDRWVFFFRNDLGANFRQVSTWRRTAVGQSCGNSTRTFKYVISFWVLGLRP